ncbi:hypothetical protein PG997_000036 [Apiospora hydei]|uniref:Cytochrome P450 n=1 Tax=Apiospora hydei TaxID=1337664 RepID=A0ABR1X9H3_9PEZI
MMERRRPYGSTLCIPILRDDVYLVQSPKNVAEFFHNPKLAVSRPWSFVLGHCFGMSKTAVDAYLQDTSGTRPEPIPGSAPRSPQDRIAYMTHENFTSGLLQHGLNPATDCFRAELQEFFKSSLDIGHDWAYMPDITDFFRQYLGSAIIRTLFGKALLTMNPTFLQDIWEYDDRVMDLAKRYPRLWIPRTYRARDRLLSAITRWHTEANRAVEPTDESAWSDSVWGTKMMRDRYRALLGATGQDKASVASTNLALIWASISNVVPSTTTLAIQIFSDSSLLSSLRGSVSHLSPDLRPKELETIPLLLSAYAETMRFGVHIHVPRNAPHHNLQIQGVTIPRDKLIFVNTYLAHNDQVVWDTQSGRKPLNQFCADRFLVDPSDPSSGPTKKKPAATSENAEGEPQYSLEGLEGAWIPFGGGQQACPGRLLAKRIMLLSAALLIRDFDLELLIEGGKPDFHSPRFGFGVSKPTAPVPFRLRRRNHVCHPECPYYIDT